MLRRLLPFAVLLIPSDAAAQDPQFGPYDVPTTFFISKSDDRNRVDYGIRLDARCAPAKDDAVFPYWRHFEPPNYGTQTHMPSSIEYVPYGISEQRSIRKTLTGGLHVLKLRQLDKSIIGILTKKEPSGKCSAQVRALIKGKESELVSIYVKLGKGGIIPSVDWVEVKGKDLETGAEIVERMTR